LKYLQQSKLEEQMLKRQLKGKGNSENSDPNEGEIEEDNYAGVSKPRVLSSGPSD